MNWRRATKKADTKSLDLIQRVGWWLLVLAIPSFSAAAEDAVSEERAFKLTSLLGESRTADIVSIDAKGVIKLTDGEASLDSLREFSRTKTTASKPDGKFVVRLVPDGKLFASQVTSDEEFCTITGHGLFDGPLKLPIDFVRSVNFQPERVVDDLLASLAEERDDDRLFLMIDGSVETIDGLIEKVGEKHVSFSWNDKLRKLPRKQVLAIGVAASGLDSSGKSVVRFSNGSSLSCGVKELSNGKLNVSISDGDTYSLPWDKVQGVSMRSDRLRFLSDMEPQQWEHVPIVTSKRPWKRDRNVSDLPLRIAGQIFNKGVGVASPSRLTYELDGNASKFCATIGIDEETVGRGDCVFVVRADGKTLERHAMKGTDPPQQLRIDIKDVRKLELIVEAGNDLDLADHANWCDACLLSD